MRTVHRVHTVALATALACMGRGTESCEEPPRVRAERRDGLSGAVRDPFASPPRDLPDPPAAAQAPADSLASVSIDELVVRGVLQSRERSVAIVQGAGTRCFLARPGDRLRDGRVQAVEVAGLVVVADAGRVPTGGGGGVRKTVRGPRAGR